MSKLRMGRAQGIVVFISALDFHRARPVPGVSLS